MTSYYNNLRKAALDLEAYLRKAIREPWSGFVLTMMKRYGFSSKKMKKMLEEMYPEVVVHMDAIYRKSEISGVPTEVAKFPAEKPSEA